MNVYALMSNVYDNAHPGSKKSWRKLNQTLREALSLAIRSEMQFEKDEIERIFNDLGGAHWFGDDEWVLGKACILGNASAARSFLAWKGRKRFVWPKCDEPRSRAVSRLNLLYVDREFPWNGETVSVTSFNDEDGTLTACSYTGGKRFTHTSKIKHRYTITPADLKVACAELEAAKVA